MNKTLLRVLLTISCALGVLVGHAIVLVLLDPDVTPHVNGQDEKKEVTPPQPKDKPIGIKWPNAILVVIPTPQPPPPVTKLTADTLYVVEWDKDFFLLASPNHLVKITKHAGPLTVYAPIVGGDGKPELKTYTGKFIYTVQGVMSGTVELIAVPVGVTDEATISRKVLLVDIGPRPPDPGPGPGPGPKPPTDPIFPLDAKTRVLMVWDVDNQDSLTAAQQASIEGIEVRKWLDSHAPNQYKIWPASVKGVEHMPQEWQKAWNKAQATKTPLPYVAISDGKGVEVIQTIPPEGVMPILTKVGGP